MDSAVHAARGAAVCVGGLTLAQSLLARRPRAPSPLALALGGFVGTFRLIESLLATRDHDNDDDNDENDQHAESGRQCEHVTAAAVVRRRRARTSMAAGAAALVALAFLEAKRKGLLISYAVVEALMLLVHEHTALAEIPHIDVAAGAAICYRIIDMWIFQSELFSASQLATLDGLSQLEPGVLRRMRLEIGTGAAVSRCDVFHRGETCGAFHTRYLVRRLLPSALKLYVPIYLLSAVIPNYKKWLWGRPRPSFTTLLQQYLRSCACLSLSYTIPIGVSCAMSASRRQRVVVTFAGLSAILAVLLEHEKRRPAVLKGIAVYPVAGTATYVAKRLGLSPRAVQWWQYAIFATALAIIFRRPEKQNARVMWLLFGHRVKTDADEASHKDQQESSTKPDNDHPSQSTRSSANK